MPEDDTDPRKTRGDKRHPPSRDARPASGDKRHAPFGDPRPAPGEKPRKPWSGRNPGPRVPPGTPPISPRDRRPEPRDPNGPAILYGWHTVKAALENPARRFLHLFATENAARRLEEENVVLPITPEIVRPHVIDIKLGPDAVHQGLLAETEPLAAPAVEHLAARGIVLVLDQITDPHNVGAIFRSASAFDVAAIVTTARHSPEATGVLAKAASGALDYVPLVTVGNLARGLEALRDRGFLIVGLDSSGESELANAKLRAPLALVLGAEGKGIRQKTRETCDVVAKLEMPGRIKSLNVSNAAALALYVAHTKLQG